MNLRGGPSGGNSFNSLQPDCALTDMDRLSGQPTALHNAKAFEKRPVSARRIGDQNGLTVKADPSVRSRTLRISKNDIPHLPSHGNDGLRKRPDLRRTKGATEVNNVIRRHDVIMRGLASCLGLPDTYRNHQKTGASATLHNSDETRFESKLRDQAARNYKPENRPLHKVDFRTHPVRNPPEPPVSHPNSLLPTKTSANRTHSPDRRRTPAHSRTESVAASALSQNERLSKRKAHLPESVDPFAATGLLKNRPDLWRGGVFHSLSFRLLLEIDALVSRGSRRPEDRSSLQWCPAGRARSARREPMS